jgi:hypothetical protein
MTAVMQCDPWFSAILVMYIQYRIAMIWLSVRGSNLLLVETLQPLYLEVESFDPAVDVDRGSRNQTLWIT